MKGDTPELVSATTAPERRVFIAVVGVLNLLFLALDVTFPFPHPAAVIGGRVAISVLFAWMAWRLARPIDARRLRALLVAFAFLATACFGLLAWGAGGVAGPYLDFMPLLPLVVIVAIPDEPGAPLASGLAGGTLALGMEMARHASPGRIVLLVLAFGSSTLYGWAGTFLFRRMRLREREAERKRAEARDALEVALRQSRRNEALYRAMAASFPEGVIALFDEELRAVLVDGAAAELQVEAAQVAGRRARDFLPAELADPVEAAQRRALSGEPASLEIRAAGRDVALSFHPVRGDGGNVLLGLALVRDVTDRKAVEARLATSARLAALGTLVAGVSHEINNPLAGAMATHGYVAEELRRLREQVSGSGDVDRARVLSVIDHGLEALDDSLVSQKRISEIVKDLSLLGRPSPPGSRVRVRQVVEGALRWVPSSLGQREGIAVSIDGDPEVVGTEGQLSQVVLNLVTNALRAAPEGRPVAVRIRSGVAAPGRVFVEVEDDGTGMDAEVQSRIFDPFFTTRAVGQGMGLGLAICHALVTAHGGTISARSAPGAGTTMRVELPAP